MTGVMERLGTAMSGTFPVPDKLNWDLFLGPAPFVPYHPVYHPFNWRGWVDWGCGALGDMGAHLIDHPFWALDLGLPTSVETVSTPFNKATYPMATTTYYQFPARGDKPAVKLNWYDGALFPPRPEELGETRLNPTGGVLYYGSKGKLMHDTYGFNPKLLPQALADSAPTPPQTAAAHHDEPRDELGGRGQEQDRGVVPVLVRRAAHRDDAARRGLAPCGDEDPLRRREHARHQQRRPPTTS